MSKKHSHHQQQSGTSAMIVNLICNPCRTQQKFIQTKFVVANCAGKTRLIGYNKIVFVGDGSEIAF